MRALVKHLDGISDDDIVELNLPTGVPLRYELDDTLRPVEAMHPLERVVGDAEAARAAAAAVAAQASARPANRCCDRCRNTLLQHLSEEPRPPARQR